MSDISDYEDARAAEWSEKAFWDGYYTGARRVIALLNDWAQDDPDNMSVEGRMLVRKLEQMKEFYEWAHNRPRRTRK